MLKEIINDGANDWIEGECGYGKALFYPSLERQTPKWISDVVLKEQILVPYHCLKENKLLGALYSFLVVNFYLTVLL